MNAQYPIGPFQKETITEEKIASWIDDIRKAPEQLKEALAGLTGDQMNIPYRQDGWTIRQVVHHLADSHLNGYVRIKLGLTENQPTIKPYDQDAWSQLADVKLPVEISLQLFSALHTRLFTLLQSLTENDLHKRVIHPEDGILSIARLISIYAWHGKHHIAQITSLRSRMEW